MSNVKMQYRVKIDTPWCAIGDIYSEDGHIRSGRLGSLSPINDKPVNYPAIFECIPEKTNIEKWEEVLFEYLNADAILITSLAKVLSDFDYNADKIYDKVMMIVKAKE